MAIGKVKEVFRLVNWRRLLFWEGLMLFLIIASGFQADAVQAALSVPVATRIEGMPVYAQQRYLSCEYAATRAAVARWGIQLNEEDFIDAIPVNENPHLGFRGNINGGWGGTTNYGIYAEPIAQFLLTRGLNTKLIWNGVASLKEEIALGRPVVVWISGGLGYASPFEAEAAGQSFWLMPYEHTVTAYGYDENGIFVADPGYGTYNYYSWSEFKRGWSYLGNMAMSVWPTSQGATQGEAPGIAPEFYRYWLRNGATELLGQPLASEYKSQGKIFQYFERTRLEYDTVQNATQVIAKGLLGRELSQGREAENSFTPLTGPEISQLSAQEQNHFFLRPVLC